MIHHGAPLQKRLLKGTEFPLIACPSLLLNFLANAHVHNFYFALTKNFRIFVLTTKNKERSLTMEEPWKMLSDLASYLEADNDSDEEEGGEYSAYKTKARGAFASPSALASRLGKRVGVSRASGHSKAASGRRCKNRYKDDDAADILKQISGTTGIGKTNVTTKSAGLAESAKGIVIPVLVADSSRPSIVEEDFEQHRSPIGMVISPNVDCVDADDATVMTETAQ